MFSQNVLFSPIVLWSCRTARAAARSSNENAIIEMFETHAGFSASPSLQRWRLR